MDSISFYGMPLPAADSFMKCAMGLQSLMAHSQIYLAADIASRASANAMLTKEQNHGYMLLRDSDVPLPRPATAMAWASGYSMHLASPAESAVCLPSIYPSRFGESLAGALNSRYSAIKDIDFGISENIAQRNVSGVSLIPWENYLTARRIKHITQQTVIDDILFLFFAPLWGFYHNRQTANTHWELGIDSLTERYSIPLNYSRLSIIPSAHSVVESHTDFWYRHLRLGEVGIPVARSVHAPRHLFLHFIEYESALLWCQAYYEAQDKIAEALTTGGIGKAQQLIREDWDQLKDDARQRYKLMFRTESPNKRLVANYDFGLF